jgi:hypothetical protein
VIAKVWLAPFSTLTAVEGEIVPLAQASGMMVKVFKGEKLAEIV